MQVGDYEWRQVSMWDFTPKNCIGRIKMVETGLSKGVCEFYLMRCKEVVSDTHWKMETVSPEDIEEISVDPVFNCPNSTYYVKAGTMGKMKLDVRGE